MYNVFMSRRTSGESEPLLIDRAAAAELPSDEAIREWAREKRAFISSVMTELPKERQRAPRSRRRYLKRLNYQKPVWRWGPRLGAVNLLAGKPCR
jgi:hypothetical protein